jgi:hypothetical protein
VARGIEMDVARVICSSFDMPPPPAPPSAILFEVAEPGCEMREVVLDGNVEGGPVVDA